MMKQQTKVWAMHDGPNCPDWCEPNKWFEVEETQSGRCFRAAGGIFVWGGLPFQRHVGPTPPDTQEAALQQLADMGQAFDADDAKPLSAFAPIGDGDVFAIYGADTPENPPYIENGTLYRVESGSLMRFGGGDKWSSIDDELIKGSESLGVAWKLVYRAGAKTSSQNAAPEANGWITRDGSAKRPKGVGKRDEGEFWYIGGAIQKCQARFVNWQHIHSYRITKRAEKRRKVWVVEYPSGAMAIFRGEPSAKTASDGSGFKLYTAKLTEVTE